MAFTAVTFYDMMNSAQQSGDMLTAGVLDTMRHESDIGAMLSWADLGTLKASGLRVKSFPTIQNRQVNGTYAHSGGTTEPLEEDGYIYGGRSNTDRIYRDAQAGMMTGDIEAQNISGYAKSLAYQLNYDLINNNPTINADGIQGLRYRFARDFSGQIIDAGGVDVSPDSASLAANFNTLYDAVESLIYSCDGHKCDALMMNGTLKLRILSGLRQLKLYATTTDSVGKTVETWGPGGPALLDMGTKQDQSTLIMPNTEGATGVIGGGTLTSIMAAKIGPEYLTGWQLNPLQTFRWQEGVIYHAEIDWYAGIFIAHPRSLGWLYNIQGL